MNSSTKKSSSPHSTHSPHGSHTTGSSHAPANNKADDDPAWNPGKPLAALMSFMEYED